MLDSSAAVREFGQIGGLAGSVAGAGDYLAGGLGRRLVLFDFVSANRLDQVGQSRPLTGDVISITVKNKVTYAGAGRGGLYALDISDSTAPRIVGHNSQYHAQEMVINQDFLFVASGYGGLILYDLTQAHGRGNYPA